MKQTLFQIFDQNSLNQEIPKIHELLSSKTYSSVLFHLYCGTEKEDIVRLVIQRLSSEFPEAEIAGSASNSEIYGSKIMQPGILLSVITFEKTEVHVKCFDQILMHETETGKQVCEFIDSFPEIKAAEILIYDSLPNSHELFDEVCHCRKEIKIFGGHPIGHDIFKDPKYVLTKDGVYENAIVIVVYAGKDFHIDVDYTAGWRTIGRSFQVTKAEKNHLYEIDHAPAYEIYEKYLRTESKEQFAQEVMEFPLMIRQDGIDILRHPTEAAEDNSLYLAGTIENGMTINLTYGEPAGIIEAVNKRCEVIREFEPECILLFTCAGRKMFWGDFIEKEIEPFGFFADTSGFCTGGEIMRNPTTGKIVEYNLTLISIAMREGEKTGREIPPFKIDDSQIRGQASLVQRFASLVQLTTEELQVAYDKLLDLNKKLTSMAITDELTGMYNRREIERRIQQSLAESNRQNKKVSLVMLDVDFFKKVNDTYGHETGDMVLKEVSAILKESVDESKGEAVGRWGGEEFFVLLLEQSVEHAIEFAERVRKKIESHHFDKINHLTVSLGVTSTSGAEDPKKIFSRVDDALYSAKANGRNCVIKAKEPE